MVVRIDAIDSLSDGTIFKAAISVKTQEENNFVSFP